MPSVLHPIHGAYYLFGVDVKALRAKRVFRAGPSACGLLGPPPRKLSDDPPEYVGVSNIYSTGKHLSVQLLLLRTPVLFPNVSLAIVSPGKAFDRVLAITIRAVESLFSNSTMATRDMASKILPTGKSQDIAVRDSTFVGSFMNLAMFAET